MGLGRFDFDGVDIWFGNVKNFGLPLFSNHGSYVADSY